MSLFEFFFAPASYGGRVGESFTSKRLRQLGNNYKVIDNIMLPSSGSTHTTQIDHVVISNYGIFCVETKAHEGLVFGSRNNKYWTYIYYRHKSKMYNPLHQNYAHIKALEHVIGWRLKAPITSFVAFPYAKSIKVSGTDSVGRIEDLLNIVNKFKQTIYSDGDRDEIYNIIMQSDVTNKQNRKIHNSEVRALSRN